MKKGSTSTSSQRRDLASAAARDKTALEPQLDEEGHPRYLLFDDFLKCMTYLPPEAADEGGVGVSYHVDQQQVDSLRTSFNSFDSDHDGVLGVVDVQTMLFSLTFPSPMMVNAAHKYFLSAVSRDGLGGMDLDKEVKRVDKDDMFRRKATDRHIWCHTKVPQAKDPKLYSMQRLITLPDITTQQFDYGMQRVNYDMDALGQAVADTELATRVRLYGR